jgi:molybdopterin-containing oxidoreductase family membrane subunit
MLVAYGYLSEAFVDWYSGVPFDQYELVARFLGPYAPCFWVMLVCNVGVLQLLWFRRLRTNMVMLFVIAIVINVGMWLERFVIVVSGPAQDFLPSSWNTATLTWLDFALLFGSLGTFFALVFLFVRILPAVTIFEVEELAHEKAEGKA